MKMATYEYPSQIVQNLSYLVFCKSDSLNHDGTQTIYLMRNLKFSQTKDYILVEKHIPVKDVYTYTGEHDPQDIIANTFWLSIEDLDSTYEFLNLVE